MCLCAEYLILEEAEEALKHFVPNLWINSQDIARGVAELTAAHRLRKRVVFFICKSLIVDVNLAKYRLFFLVTHAYIIL